MFKVTLAQAIFHNHRFDTAYDGRYVVRLPDLTLVYAQDYERRLTEYQARQLRGCHQSSGLADLGEHEGALPGCPAPE